MNLVPCALNGAVEILLFKNFENAKQLVFKVLIMIFNIYNMSHFAQGYYEKLKTWFTVFS